MFIRSQTQLLAIYFHGTVAMNIANVVLYSSLGKAWRQGRGLKTEVRRTDLFFSELP